MKPVYLKLVTNASSAQWKLYIISAAAARAHSDSLVYSRPYQPDIKSTHEAFGSRTSIGVPQVGEVVNASRARAGCNPPVSGHSVRITRVASCNLSIGVCRPRMCACAALAPNVLQTCNATLKVDTIKSKRVLNKPIKLGSFCR